MEWLGSGTRWPARAGLASPPQAGSGSWRRDEGAHRGPACVSRLPVAAGGHHGIPHCKKRAGPLWLCYAKHWLVQGRRALGKAGQRRRSSKRIERISSGWDRTELKHCVRATGHLIVHIVECLGPNESGSGHQQ